MFDREERDKRKLKNWRPISLVNADAKILSSIFVSRLNKFNDRYLEKTQIVFKKKELIYKNVLAVGQTIKNTNRNKEKGAVLFLDQLKAYDRVGHDYFYKLLNTIGLGDK